MIQEDTRPTDTGSDGAVELTHQAPVVIEAAALQNSRHELFAQHVAAGHSLADSYRAAGYSDAVYAAVTAHSSRLAASHVVQARINALKQAAAQRAEISIASRMAWLDSVVHADAAELSRVVACPCRFCWDDAAYAVAVQRYMSSTETAAPLPPPDTTAPRADCPIGPHQRVELVPTAELSGSARAAYRGARMKADGSIEVLLEDRQSAVDLLNRMQSVYVQRTESRSLSISATVDATDATPEALLAAYNRSRGMPVSP
jgi:hypothetical protein